MEKCVHILKLRDPCLCADAAHGGSLQEGSERNLQNQEISLWDSTHTMFPTSMMKWLTATQVHLERCQTPIQSQFHIQSCAVFPCIVKFK
jgi:hypothetical protein